MGAGSVSRGLGVDHLPSSIADVTEYSYTSTPLQDLPGLFWCEICFSVPFSTQNQEFEDSMKSCVRLQVTRIFFYLEDQGRMFL